MYAPAHDQIPLCFLAAMFWSPAENERYIVWCSQPAAFPVVDPKISPHEPEKVRYPEVTSQWQIPHTSRFSNKQSNTGARGAQPCQARDAFSFQFTSQPKLSPAHEQLAPHVRRRASRPTYGDVSRRRPPGGRCAPTRHHVPTSAPQL
jgi:hypothetical protein